VLAQELGPRGIRVNAVAPGVIETEMSADVREQSGDKVLKRFLLRRYVKPEEVAYAAWFLASACASYVSGQVFGVDGWGSKWTADVLGSASWSTRKGRVSWPKLPRRQRRDRRADPSASVRFAGRRGSAASDTSPRNRDG